MFRIENNIFGNNTSLIIDLLKKAYSAMVWYSGQTISLG
jgi:hypothetical protein